jgi:gliding motility-associatede transport system auxiliary component
VIRKILGLVGWIGAALVFAAVAIRFTRPEWQWYSSLAIAGLVCTLLYMLSQWREIARSFSGRQARYGTLSIASVLVVLGILVGINWIANRQNKRWDLTASKAFTLSDQTKKVLETLPNPVNIKVFAKGDDFDRYRDRLDEFQYASKKVNVEYIDVYKRPAVAEQYQVQQEGTVVFEYAGRTERATSDSEQDLANALIKAVQGKEKKVYFVQGHGEKDTTGSDRTGYNGISQALKGDNFKVETLALAQQNAVPDDATVVVIAGPRADYLPGEIDMLRAYLKKGGRLLLLLDPPARADSSSLTNLPSLLHEWGINAGNDVVVDVSGIGRLIGTDASVPVAVNYPAHPAVERFNLMTAYPLARSMAPVSGGVDGRTAQTIIETSPNSWAESDVKTLLATGKVARDEKEGDKPGPISLGAAVSAAATEAPAAKPANQVEAPKEEETKKPEARVVAIGDSDFAANGFLGLPGSRDLFMNVTNWLAGQENMIAIRPRDAQDRRIAMTADQQRRVMWLTIFIIPGLIIVTGIHTWWRRR